MKTRTEERIVSLINQHQNHSNSSKKCERVVTRGSWERQRVASGEGMNLDLSGNMQFGGVQLQQQIQSTEEQDGNDDGKIADQGAELEGTFRERQSGERTEDTLVQGGEGGAPVWVR